MRRRAIAAALWYGVVPSWVYERRCHHRLSWWRHALLNLQVALTWATGRETDEDVQFERRTNAAPRWIKPRAVWVAQARRAWRRIA
jgi:hypothetical protein